MTSGVSRSNEASVCPLPSEKRTMMGNRMNARSRCKVDLRLAAAGDLKRLNVGRSGHLSFEDGGVERPLHFRHRPLNTCQPGRALRTTPRDRGKRRCPTQGSLLRASYRATGPFRNRLIVKHCRKSGPGNSGLSLVTAVARDPRGMGYVPPVIGHFFHAEGLVFPASLSLMDGSKVHR